ncbi:MAG: hypothetical protein LBK00_04830 [Treponema sp.]|nr:hypothetical protein [Treponema sp.]
MNDRHLSASNNADLAPAPQRPSAPAPQRPSAPAPQRPSAPAPQRPNYWALVTSVKPLTAYIRPFLLAFPFSITGLRASCQDT